MQQVANVGAATFRSGTYADRVYRGAFYTFGTITGMYVWAKDSDSSFWTQLMLPLIKRFNIDEEWCLRTAIGWLGRGRGPFDYTPSSTALSVSVFGKDLDHPLCLGAGFDRDGEAIYGCFGLGFSGVEIGTVAPQKQAGNGLPRIFRINHDEAVLHRCGTPSRGMAVVGYFVDEFRKWEDRTSYPMHRRLLGVNVGRNKITDAEHLADDARIGVKVMSETADYICVNLPHPTRPGARALRSRQWLDELARTCVEQRAKLPAEQRRPILFKVPLDATEEDRADLASVALKRRLDGLVVGGGTLGRPGAVAFHYLSRQPGTMCGKPTRDESTEMIRDLYKRTGGKVTLVGSGGIATGQDALEKIEAGATLLQLYSSMVQRGPGVVPQIKRDLTVLLQDRGYESVKDAIGAGARQA